MQQQTAHDSRLKSQPISYSLQKIHLLHCMHLALIAIFFASELVTCDNFKCQPQTPIWSALFCVRILLHAYANERRKKNYRQFHVFQFSYMCLYFQVNFMTRLQQRLQFSLSPHLHIVNYRPLRSWSVCLKSFMQDLRFDSKQAARLVCVQSLTMLVMPMHDAKSKKKKCIYISHQTKNNSKQICNKTMIQNRNTWRFSVSKANQPHI